MEWRDGLAAGALGLGQGDDSLGQASLPDLWQRYGIIGRPAGLSLAVKHKETPGAPRLFVASWFIAGGFHLHQALASGQHAHRAGGGGNQQEQQAQRPQAVGLVADQAHAERAERGQRIADALGHAGQVGGDMGIRRAQRQQAQRHAEQATLAQAQQHRPEQQAVGGSEQHAQQAELTSATVAAIGGRWSRQRCPSAGTSSEEATCTMMEMDSSRPVQRRFAAVYQDGRYQPNTM